MRADAEVSSLAEFRWRKLYQTQNGKAGRGKKQHGKNGENLVLLVPPGTIIFNKIQIEGNAVIADLEKEGQEVVVARGGRGGWGNVHFASSINQAPTIAQKGEPGEEKALVLEMRLIADVGIIGYPNAGKSTLLAAVSAANPKIGDYPFTTREPILGMVYVGQRSFSLAEIPGLISGAHLGRGLGHDFLRHALRTKMFIHLVDGAAASPAEDMVKVNTELSLFDSALGQKPQIVAVNKIDLPGVRERQDEIRKTFREIGLTPYFISAVNKEEVGKLMAAALDMLATLSTSKPELGEEMTPKVFHPQPRVAGTSVRKKEGYFIVTSPGLERIISGLDMANPEANYLVKKRLARMGINKMLAKAGARPGDRIRCGTTEWRWEAE